MVELNPHVAGAQGGAQRLDRQIRIGGLSHGARECTEHQKDEYLLVEDLLAAKEIYRKTIETLANLV